MLTSLNFLDIGQIWPHIGERERLEMYSINRDLFESKHADVYKADLKRIERVIGNFNEVISYPVVLNFQKLMSLKIADLLLGEPPTITCGDPESKEQNAIEEIKKRSDFINTCNQLVLDISRFGDGLFHIRQKDGIGLIDITQPQIWFPIVSPDDVRDIQYHVLAWTYETEEREQVAKYLKVRIHKKGSYEERIYRIAGDEISQQISTQIIKTGLDDFAIIQVSNVITSDRATGLDDYTDVDSIIGEILVRVGQIARILDKHAAPSMSGPTSALERDPATGDWRLKTGNYFPRDTKEDPDISYITWDGQLAANFTMIEKLVNFLYTISEMGSAIFGDMTASGGTIPSGTALKRLMISPLAKVQRIRTRLDPAVKKAFALCSQLKGKGIVSLSESDISITWEDGLPGDAMEDALIIEKRTAGKATMSQYRVLTDFDKLTDEQADEELARMIDEDEAAMPVNIPPLAMQPESGPQVPIVPNQGTPADAEALDLEPDAPK